MKLFIDDIKKIDWLTNAISYQKWGKEFLTLKKGFFFVFDYNLVEQRSSIEVENARHLYEINDSIYRNMVSEHVGYMKEPFDTSNYLFFSLLKSACETYPASSPHAKENEWVDKLTDLWMTYKSQDLAESKKNLKVRISGVQEINSHISFSTALNNIYTQEQVSIFRHLDRKKLIS